MSGRFLLAATGSGHGKTTLTCGLLYLMREKKYHMACAKCGPDYIDPMFHKRILGLPSGNLDGFFLDTDELRSLCAEYEKDGDILMIEGVMGYYDGIGDTSHASSYEVAVKTDTPVVLLVDCKGMAASAKAVLQGFAGYQVNHCIKAVLWNRLPAAYYEDMRAFSQSLGIKSIGYVPNLPSHLQLKSRHLGLVMAGEIKNFKELMQELAEVLEKTIDVEALADIADGAQPLTGTDKEKKSGTGAGGQHFRVAVAKDEAFCFLYEDNLRMLEKAGCEIVYFSPLHDAALPKQCQGLLLSGGYPERYAKELSDNKSMLQSVGEAVERGICCLAECGGYLYLHDKLQDEKGTLYPMVGVISATALRQPKLQHFGYVYVTLLEDSLIGKKGDCYTAHEFHYWQSKGEEQTGAFRCEKASGQGEWCGGVASPTLYAAYPHFFYRGNQEIVKNFCLAMKESAI